MNRCDYCEYRNSWDCDDYKLGNDVFCESFRLDFFALSEPQKKAIQRKLMAEGGAEERYYDN